MDVRLVPRLNSIEEAGFENFTFFFLEADDEGVTQSFDFPGDILIGCKVREYHCPTVEANRKEVLLREVTQEAMVLTNSFHGV